MKFPTVAIFEQCFSVEIIMTYRRRSKFERDECLQRFENKIPILCPGKQEQPEEFAFVRLN